MLASLLNGFSKHNLNFSLFQLLTECQCQIHTGGGGKLPPYSQSLPQDENVINGPVTDITKLPHPLKLNPHTHLIGNSQSLQLPQIHSPQTKLTVQIGDTVQLPCKVHNLGEIISSNLNPFEN